MFSGCGYVWLLRHLIVLDMVALRSLLVSLFGFTALGLMFGVVIMACFCLVAYSW